MKTIKEPVLCFCCNQPVEIEIRPMRRGEMGFRGQCNTPGCRSNEDDKINYFRGKFPRHGFSLTENDLGHKDNKVTVFSADTLKKIKGYFPDTQSVKKAKKELSSFIERHPEYNDNFSSVKPGKSPRDMY